jgi:hypothetical protein
MSAEDAAGTKYEVEEIPEWRDDDANLRLLRGALADRGLCARDAALDTVCGVMFVAADDVAGSPALAK